LVNPVPVSACRALDAKFIIAVNLNGQLTSKRIDRQRESSRARRIALEGLAKDWLPDSLKKNANNLIERTLTSADDTPSYTDVMIGAVNIMQDRITRSRMAGDPPDILLAPRLGHLGFMDYDRASESIQEGRDSVIRMLPAITDLFSRLDDPV
ncbi:MAG: hypothetical protein KDJ38_11875, partial [Gammaproteobacteria bacterium]|nr:hypothetical protein [Gammaproteobacteria bacterium]